MEHGAPPRAKLKLRDVPPIVPTLQNSVESQNRVDDMINSGVVRRLVELLDHRGRDQKPSVMIQIPALRALGNVCQGSDTQTDYAIDCSILPPLMKMLKSDKAVGFFE